jgi:hypothetical protein
MFSLQVASQTYTLSRARSTTNSMHNTMIEQVALSEYKQPIACFFQQVRQYHSFLSGQTHSADPFPGQASIRWSFNSSLEKQKTFSTPNVDCRID